MTDVKITASSYHNATFDQCFQRVVLATPFYATAASMAVVILLVLH